MTDTMTNGPAPAQPAATNGGKNGERQVVVRPFIAGSRSVDEPDYDETETLSTSSVRLESYNISPNGYLSGIWLLVEATGDNTSADVALAEDGPFNVFQNVNLQDTNSQPIVGPMDGYDLYILNKYGGYWFSDDAKQSPIFSTTEGTGATAGSFTFALFVPLEIVRRDALGSQPNKSGSSQFSLVLSLAPESDVFDTVTDNGVSVRCRATLLGWQDPDSNDSRGNPTAQDPPAVQTTSYWHKQTYNALSGSVNTRLQGIDGLLRAAIFVNRDTSSRSSGDTAWPDPFTLKYENSLLIESRIQALWQHLIAVNFGYSAAAEAAGGRDNGVYPIWEWMHDYGHKPGRESRFGYLPMSSASNLSIQGSFSSASDLTLLVNKIVPFPQGNVKGLTGGR